MSNLYSIGQMNQLGDALEKAGFSANEITKLQHSPQLAAIRELLYGRATLSLPEHLIDCDSDPCVPQNWSLKSHLKMGVWKWQPEKVVLFKFKEQAGSKRIGEYLYQKLEESPVLNANVLDYLLQHHHLIPSDWKNVFVFFWGTIYFSSGGKETVRCLRFNQENKRWGWFWAHLDYRFSLDNCPAAMLSNSDQPAQ